MCFSIVLPFDIIGDTNLSPVKRCLSESQGEKALYELFKSALLKKYKDSYDVEVLKGEVKKETVDKSIDFLFADACARFRSLPNIDEFIKEDVISQAQKALGSWKTMVTQMLKDKGITVV